MNQQPTTDPNLIVKKPGAGFKIAWWVWAIVIVAVLAIASGLIVKFTGKTDQANIATTKPDTKEEITVKQFMSSLRGDIVRWHDDKKTYEGWKPNANSIDQVKKMGSEIKTQALTKDTYIIYALMPSSKTKFCMDHTGFTGEVEKLSSLAKACK